MKQKFCILFEMAEVQSGLWNFKLIKLGYCLMFGMQKLLKWFTGLSAGVVLKKEGSICVLSCLQRFVSELNYSNISISFQD